MTPAPKETASKECVTLFFFCYICEESSTEICTYCTKDCCELHRCEKCLRCTDCCLCHLSQIPRR